MRTRNATRGTTMIWIIGLACGIGSGVLVIYALVGFGDGSASATPRTEMERAG